MTDKQTDSQNSYINIERMKMKLPDIGLRGEYQIEYRLWSHPANRHQSAAVESVVIFIVNVTCHAKVCTNHTTDAYITATISRAFTLIPLLS